MVGVDGCLLIYVIVFPVLTSVGLILRALLSDFFSLLLCVTIIVTGAKYGDVAINNDITM